MDALSVDWKVTEAERELPVLFAASIRYLLPETCVTVTQADPGVADWMAAPVESPEISTSFAITTIV
jgi:hypothetical protein